MRQLVGGLEKMSDCPRRRYYHPKLKKRWWYCCVYCSICFAATASSGLTGHVTSIVVYAAIATKEGGSRMNGIETIRSWAELTGHSDVQPNETKHENYSERSNRRSSPAWPPLLLLNKGETLLAVLRWICLWRLLRPKLLRLFFIESVCSNRSHCVALAWHKTTASGRVRCSRGDEAVQSAAKVFQECSVSKGQPRLA